jgi:hypothetical protein
MQSVNRKHQLITTQNLLVLISKLLSYYTFGADEHLSFDITLLILKNINNLTICKEARSAVVNEVKILDKFELLLLSFQSQEEQELIASTFAILIKNLCLECDVPLILIIIKQNALQSL